MAQVFEYIIITQTRHDYRATGTSHKDAMNSFIADPPLIYGFHAGNYEAESGENFIVIGPTQTAPDSNVIERLIAKERTVFYFRTPDEAIAEDETRREVRSFLQELDGNGDTLVVVDARDENVPPHNKTAPAGTIASSDPRGLWINDKRIPWSAVRGISTA